MIEHTYDVSGSPDLEIRIPAGRVEIVEGRPGKVKVSVDTKDSDFIVEQRGDLILASTSPASGGWVSRSARVVVEAPANSCAEISTASANISVRTPLHKASIKTASGNITLDTVESAVIKTASGDATIRSVAKSLKYNTASGDLDINGHVGGSAIVVSVSGDIEIEDSNALLDFKTVSGSAKIRRFTGNTANFRAVSGDFEVAVPPGTKLHLEAETRSGRVNLPTDPPPVKEIRREMTIKGRLISGNVTIKRTAE